MSDLSRIRALPDQRRHRHTLPQAFYTDPDVLQFDVATADCLTVARRSL